MSMFALLMSEGGRKIENEVMYQITGKDNLKTTTDIDASGISDWDTTRHRNTAWTSKYT